MSNLEAHSIGIFSVKNSLLKNGFYNALAGAIRIGLALLTIPILIRIIGVEEYGLWTLASAVVQIVNLAEAGLSMATTVFLSQDLAKEDIDGVSQTLTVTIGAMLVLSTLAATCLWVGAESIVSFFPKLGQSQRLAVTQAIQIGSFVVWTRLLQQVLIGVKQAYQRYDLISILNSMQWMLISLGLFTVAWFGGRIVELMQWYAFASTSVLLSHIWIARSLLRGINLRPILKVNRAIAIARYSLMTWLATLGATIFSKGDRLIVGSLLGSETLGIYSAITDSTGAIATFSSLPVQPLVPTLSSHIAEQDANQGNLKQQVKQAFEINALVALSCSSLLLMLAPLVMQIMVGSAVNNENIFAFKIATVIYGLYSLNAVGFYILLSLAGNLCMTIQLVSAIFSLLLISLGAYYFGLIGATLGNIGFITTTWLFSLTAIKQVKLSFKLWVKWLIFPLIWYWFSISVGFLMPFVMNLNILAGTLSIVVFLFWFLKSQNLTLKLIVQKCNRVLK
jgi:O-antigen/teichoic acid export membrane protein